MKTAFRVFSIQRKLIVVFAAVAIATVTLACGTFVAADLVTFRGGTAEGINTLADVAGANCTAALTFDDAKGAEDTLAALGSIPPLSKHASIARTVPLWRGMHETAALAISRRPRPHREKR